MVQITLGDKSNATVVDPLHFDADPDLTYQSERMRMQIKAQTWKSAQIGSYSIHLACHLEFDADPDPLLDLAYLFDADADPDPDFYFISDPDPQHCLTVVHFLPMLL